MMNRHPVPSLDSCLSELLHEEKRIVTQAAREHRATVRDKGLSLYYHFVCSLSLSLSFFHC